MSQFLVTINTPQCRKHSQKKVNFPPDPSSLKVVEMHPHMHTYRFGECV